MMSSCPYAEEWRRREVFRKYCSASQRLCVSASLRNMIKGLFLLHEDAYHGVYTDIERREIDALINIYAPPQTAESLAQNPGIVEEAEVIVSGWGMVRLDEAFLAQAPNLKAVFYGAGSIRGFMTDVAWERGIIVTNAYAANADAVAAYTLSQILFSLKCGWHFALNMKQGKYLSWNPNPDKDTIPGTYQTTIGLISLGMIGRKTRELLRPFGLNILAYDPYLTPDEAQCLDVEICSLEDLFARSDVVSLHTPWLKETEGMVTGKHLASMKLNSTFINTSRGAVVKELELIEVLQKRPDLYAVLDVTYPEPPEPDSPLRTLSNVILTPHISGVAGPERRSMGQLIIQELRRYVNGEPLQWAISRERAAIMA